VDIPNEHILQSRYHDYRAVVIPDNQREVLPQTLAALKCFVHDGGLLLIIGSGMLHAQGKEDDIEALIGLRRSGTSDRTHVLNTDGKNVSFPSVYNVGINGAEVLAEYGNGKPFLTKNTRGNGAVAYVSAASIPFPDNDGVINWIMKKVNVHPWVTIQSGGRDKHLVFSFRSKPGRLLLHVANITSHVKGKRIETNANTGAIDPVSVIPGLTMNLNLPAEPQRVAVVPAVSGVEHSWNNGTLNLTIKDLDYHAAVEMVIDGHYSR
jgi:hypothetical protein